MKRQAWASAGFATLLALSLGACGRTDQAANAPAGTGSSSTAEVVRPAAPDGPPGGPSGVAGSGPHTGSSGGDVMPGTTGRGTSEVGGRSSTEQAGTGLNGGLGNGTTTSAPMGAGAGGGGSPNSTSGSAVGAR